MPSSSRVWAITATKNVRPEDEQHRVERGSAASSPRNDSTCSRIHHHQPCWATSTCHGEVSKPAKGRDDDQQHAVGQRVLVDLVREGAEQEEAENRGQHFERRAARPGTPSRGRQAEGAAAATAHTATRIAQPESMTTRGAAGGDCCRVTLVPADLSSIICRTATSFKDRAARRQACVGARAARRADDKARVQTRL